jgi:hydrogenase/urease accessory protein HupE
MKCSQRSTRLFAALLRAASLGVAVCSAALTVQAHDPLLSAAELRIARGGVAVHLSFVPADLESLISADSNKDGKTSVDELTTGRSRVEALAVESVEVSFDGQVAAARQVTVEVGEGGTVEFDLWFAADAISQILFRSSVIQRMPRGHRQYLVVKDEAGRQLVERVLDSKADSLELNLAQMTGLSKKPASFRQFVSLGVLHILTGYDHLIFLVGLLVAGATFREVARIITSFTVAHSITLGLATFNLVAIPSSIVEPLIAASIVYIGVENLFRRERKWRWLLTFGFGLVHGFGFALALRELGIGSNGGAAVSLLSFNLGVELGQIAIAAALLPVIWKLRKRPLFVTRCAPVCSVLISFAGAFWLIERTILK